jgi:hypothetical protein
VDAAERRRADEEVPMKYLLTIYADESRYATMTPEDSAALMQAYGRFGTEAEAAGVLLGGEGLQPTATATTVRVRDGETLLTDGPFAETREQLGGYYLLECADLDEANRWAARIPDANGGAVEVRPVMVYEAMGREEAHTRTEGVAQG